MKTPKKFNYKNIALHLLDFFWLVLVVVLALRVGDGCEVHLEQLGCLQSLQVVTEYNMFKYFLKRTLQFIGLEEKWVL